MRAKVIRPFNQIVRLGEEPRSRRKGDVITVSEKDFKKLGDFYLQEVPTTTKLTPMRDADGECIPCKKKK